MESLTLEKTKKQKFTKTKEFLACTLLTTGLIFGSGCSGCKEKIEEQPVVKQEVMQEQILNLRQVGVLSQFKVNQKGNLEIELEKDKPIPFPVRSQPIFFRNKNRENRFNDDYEITLLESDKGECKIKIKRTNVRNVPQKDGKEMLHFSEDTEKVITLKEGETTTLDSVYETEDKRRVEIKFLGEEKFEIFFQDGFGKPVPFLDENELKLHEGFYVDGERIQEGRRNVNAFNVVENSYVKGREGAILTKQKITFNQPLEFDSDFIINNSVEARRAHIEDWLKRNGSINLLGEKFTLDYLISDEKLSLSGRGNYLSGVFVLTHVETGQEIYVPRMQFLARDRGRRVMDSITNTHDGKTYSSVIKVNGETDYRISFDKTECDKMGGFTIELIK